MELKIIAKVKSEFTDKFGIPRQSGILKKSPAQIVFEPEYQNREAVRGLEEFSHIWVLWGFSKNEEKSWSPTVRPPRLGGNTRMGVFATRSPYRPNPIGISSVELEKIEYTKEGPVLHIKGADILDGTPVYDIKPYLAYTDCHVEARGGFAGEVEDYCAEVEIPEELAKGLDESFIENLVCILKHDPRPSYKKDETRVYGFFYGGYEIKFEGFGTRINVISIEKEEEKWL